MERIFELNNYLDIDIIDLWHFRTDYGDIETAYWQAYYGIKANQDTDLIYIAGLYDHFLYLHALREYTYQAPIIIKGQQTAPNGKPYYILEIWTPGDWTNAQTHCLGYNLVYACAFRFKAKRDNAYLI